MTNQSSGSGTLPGASSDGLVPGGLKIAGGLAAGDPTAASVPSAVRFYGTALFQDSPGNNEDVDDVLDVLQGQDLVADSSVVGLSAIRTGALNGHNYTSPLVRVNDETAATSPVLQVRKNSVTQLQVDGDGVQVHGKLKTGASVTHTLGAYSGKSVPIYDEAGTLLGYMPLYA